MIAIINKSLIIGTPTEIAEILNIKSTKGSTATKLPSGEECQKIMDTQKLADSISVTGLKTLAEKGGK